MVATTSNEELLDIVDKDDVVIGQMTYDMFYNFGMQKGLLIRGSTAFIRNKEGKLWIPRRLKTKRLKPNALDFSVAEHVSAGEDYLTAVIRGFHEELDMVVKPKDLKPIGKIVPTSGMSFFTQGFILNSETSPNYNKGDFYEYFWLSPDELIEKVKSGDAAKDAIVPMLLLIKENSY